jgi:hypothetical protein
VHDYTDHVGRQLMFRSTGRQAYPEPDGQYRQTVLLPGGHADIKLLYLVGRQFMYYCRHTVTVPG